MVLAERKFIDERVEKIIAFKRKVCEGACDVPSLAALLFAPRPFLCAPVTVAHTQLASSPLPQLHAGNDKSFVVVNQKGIDPFSLDLLAREGIMALRRAKRRNMER